MSTVCYEDSLSFWRWKASMVVVTWLRWSDYVLDSVSESGNRSPRLSINNNSLLNNNFLPTAAASKPTGPSAFQQSPWQQRQQQTKQSFVSLDQSQQPGQLRLPSPRSASSATTVTPPQNQAQLKRSLYQEVPAVQPSVCDPLPSLCCQVDFALNYFFN